MAANLRWTRSGTVWADFLMTGLPYGLRPTKDKHAVRALHQALFRGLPGESLLLGLCSGLDPAAVVERMLASVDVATCPDWVAECEATMDSLDLIGPGQRIHWLSVPLSSDRPADRFLEPWRAATADLRDRIGLPRAPIPVDEADRRLAQAARIAESIPSPFAPSPVTPAQMVWLHEHAIRRGLFQDLDLPTGSPGDVAAALLIPKTSSALGEPLLDEGGQSDPGVKGMTRRNPIHRRFLKVQDAHSVLDASEASYQALLVVSDVPDGGMVFPGSEFIGRIDESGLDVDWAIRLNQRSSAQVASQNRKALRNLNEQYGQRDGEVSHGMNTLDLVAKDLAEYVSLLESDKLEVEVQATTIFCVAGPTAESAQTQARALTDFLGDTGYKLSSPLGYQEELWWAMTPGVPSTRAVREFAQITTSRALAATVPLASVTLGDTKGSLLALNIAHGPMFAPNVPCGPTSVILHDLEGATDRDVSGSIAIAGELGSGKALALDTPIPTPTGWALMGNLAPGDTVIDEQGHPTTVLSTSAVMYDHPCYEVEFSDGSALVADAEHLWTTLPERVRSRAAKVNWKSRAAGGVDLIDFDENTAGLTGPGWAVKGVTSTTQQLLDTLHHGVQANHAIPVTQPLELPTADLPIDPYVLGCWLGDGTSRCAQITSADPEILVFIEAAGYTVTKLRGRHQYGLSIPHENVRQPVTRPCGFCGASMLCRYEHRLYCSHRCAGDARRAGYPPAPRGSCDSCGRELAANSTGRRCSSCWHAASLTGRLSVLGLLRNKHVPPLFLRASRDQRRALLAGLLDTDGTVASGGSVKFTTTTRQLAVDTHEIACSLGFRATLREGRAKLNGRDCGPKWTIAFSTDEDVFCLPRKVRTHTDRRQRFTAARTRHRYIVAIRRTTSVPVRCIQVAADSQLFLAGRAMIPTHNSVTLKKLAGDVIDRGGHVIIADRTAMGEWASWADSVTRAVVIDIADPAFSLDPLRLFGPAIGSRIAQSFLTPLLNVAPTSERGVSLSDVLDPRYLADHGLTSLGGLLGHLQAGCDVPGAADMARLINVFARRDFGRAIFDERVPTLQLSDPAVIIRTHTLLLPSREELEHQHLFEQLGLEKIFGRAMYALIASLARHVCFADRDTLGFFVVDEAHSVTISPEGEREIVDFVRDGRKHRAAIGLGSHDPEADFGSPTLRGLIPTRILMRHRDKTLAQRGLAWLDLDPTDDSLVDLVRNDMSPVQANGVPEHRRGECLIHDTSGNVGRGKILVPAVATRGLAVRTSGPSAGSPLDGATS